MRRGLDLMVWAGRLKTSDGAYHRDQVTVPFCPYLEHRPTVFLVEEGDALDQAREAFGELLRGLLLQINPWLEAIGESGAHQ